MFVFLKSIFSSLIRIGRCYYLPAWIGFSCFILFHNIVDKYIEIRIPFLSKTVLSEHVDRTGQLFLGAEQMTETKLMFLYFIFFSVISIGTAASFSPLAGSVVGGLVLCIIEFVLIRACCLADGQTTIFANCGIIIERIVDFEDLRIIFENLCLNYYCIEPGMNPCKMARDCINGHELEGKLMQDMIEYIGYITEDYDSWAGLAGEYVDKIGPRHTRFTHGYGGYDVGPDPRLQPPVIEQKLYGEEPFGGNNLYMGIGAAVAYGFCTFMFNSIVHLV